MDCRQFVGAQLTPDESEDRFFSKTAQFRPDDRMMPDLVCPVLPSDTRKDHRCPHLSASCRRRRPGSPGRPAGRQSSRPGLRPGPRRRTRRARIVPRPSAHLLPGVLSGAQKERAPVRWPAALSAKPIRRLTACAARSRTPSSASWRPFCRRRWWPSRRSHCREGAGWFAARPVSPDRSRVPWQSRHA